MSEIYGEPHRALQRFHDTRQLADKVKELIVQTEIAEDHKYFIESRDMFFLSSVDHRGYPTCSYKGGTPGFVKVVDKTTLAFPNYDGNGMYLSMGNLRANPHVGILFIDWENQWRLRYNGVATVSENDPLLAEYPEAQFIVRVEARQVFPNCPRYIHKMHLVERSRFVPHMACQTPIPDWKRGEWVADVLPANDPAHFIDPNEE